MYLPAVIPGLLLVFCFPGFGYYPLAWIVLTPFLVSLLDKTPQKAFLSGMLLGIPYFFGTTYWIYHSVTYYGHIPFIASIALVFMLSLYLSLYTGLFGLLFSMKIKKSALPAMLLAPVFWVTIEFIRSYALTGFPWSSIGYSQFGFLTAIQVSDITGIYGVSFLVLAVNGALADIFILRRRRSSMPLFASYHTIIGYIVLSALFISSFAYGYWRIHQNRHGSDLRVSIVQGNIEQDKKWDAAYQSEVINTYKELTLKAFVYSPSLIIWPETSLPFYFGTDTGMTEDLLNFKRQIGADLLLGTVILKERPSANSPARLSNSAVLLDNDGKPTYIYDKIHLVPFGEYVPLRRVLFFVDKLVAGIGDYTPGEALLKANTPYGSFATFICYEIIFPGLVRKFYSKDGDFIVTITNDAWFGKTAGPEQHFSMAVFRAIENRKPVVRAANTGISGFIDSNGKILLRTVFFERTTETAHIKTDQSRSFYSRYGDIFSYVCIVLTLLLIL